ncbi:hypothetical protein K488DRAFT_50550 [Vararia minispora EC-137]|uniref:Uncharacterized protein n=1 Tax=Vararia minispora EC-137 TaxID=1314806 RepID=A0ACB8QJX1_9AGAM|nr:hypothetical protein K488DRAFT_50550 [Vararia minispora EC-137]
MEGWTDRLHTGFLGEHVLVTELRLTSFGAFCIAALVTLVICIVERAIAIALSKRWVPFRVAPGKRGRIQNTLWRMGLNWIATLLQILYMLIAMSFHIGLIFIIVTTLAVGQCILESLEEPPARNLSRYAYDIALSGSEPLLSPENTDSSTIPRHDKSPSSPLPRQGSRAKPSSIFIHPTQSNLARADAAAVELGLHGSTGLVSAGETSAEPWVGGKGREVAREIMGPTKGKAGPHHRTSSQARLFHVGESDSDDGI